MTKPGLKAKTKAKVDHKKKNDDAAEYLAQLEKKKQETDGEVCIFC